MALIKKKIAVIPAKTTEPINKKRELTRFCDFGSANGVFEGFTLRNSIHPPANSD
jgi:hypothetical protein